MYIFPLLLSSYSKRKYVKSSRKKKHSGISGLFIEPRLNKPKQQHKIFYRVKIHKQSGFWQGRAFPFLYHLARVTYSNEGHQKELWCLDFFARILTITNLVFSILSSAMEFNN